MNNLNPIRYASVIALISLASCKTGEMAMQGETDNLYFMASDAKIATEYAVKNNTADNFRSLEQAPSADLQLENFSSRNVNPEYIAKYQRSTQPEEEGSVYFDDSQTQSFAPQAGNIDAYDNFRGGSNNITNNFFGGPTFGMGMGMGMWPMGGMGMWPMGGFYDPFWGPGFGGMGMFDPFWGPGFGFRPGFNVGFGMGFGNPWMRTSLAFGNPWMMRPGFGFYDPWMMRGMLRPGFYNPIIVIPGGEGAGRQIVRGARPSMGSSLANATPRSRATAQPGSTRANARREAIGAGPNARQATSTSSRNSFSRSQNDYYRNPSASATPARRNVSSPVVTRPTSSTATRSSTYGAPNSRANVSAPRTTAPSNFNTRSVNSGTNRSGYTSPTRSTSPSYNRSSAPSRSMSSPNYNTRSSSPTYNTQRSTMPSRSSYSAPSRSTYSAPSSSGGGGFSRGGGSVGGGRRGN
ncbi:hypothetical protein [Lunatimonas salinarum]|uniref:hypothetical protein n=1 Tax=Lunatimonas salinarum TaxID=1774590 RepID=UPI001FD7674A|nr:hypothetical protein [Lunatimonas salinarum]